MLLNFSAFSFAQDSGNSKDPQDQLMRDLLITAYWNQKQNERLPVTYNHLLQGGYFNMPSARMGSEGEFGAGFASVPPYRLYSLRCQLLEQLELTFNYRIFRGVEDPILGPLGFGDYSDKGANVKLALFLPEDSHYTLPGLAIGFEDVMGTRNFNSQYIVLTQVLLDYNMEISLGYGRHRIRGFFGGMSWLPFRTSNYEYLKGLSVAVEYDAIPYHDEEIEKHPKGRSYKSRWNFGLKYRCFDSWDLSVAVIRGNAVALTASGYFNFGASKGVIPKIEDTLPYRAPVNIQTIGYLRPEDVVIQDLIYALRDQGFDLTDAWMHYECEQKVLRLQLINMIYREENSVRDRLNALLAALVPLDISRVIVTIEIADLPVQEYHYEMEYLREYRDQQMSRYEISILTPLKEVTFPNPFCSKLLFRKKKELWNLEILPKTNLLFGSATGKFKYGIGLSLALNGFLWDEVFYSISLGYFAFTNISNVGDMDRLNPSQLINVRTDLINYYRPGRLTIDEAYIQKLTNWGKGWYTRSAIGLFEVEYGGAAGEILYYPVNSPWAIGIEGAVVKKRRVNGIGFTDKIRKLHGFKPTYQRFIGSQYFLNAYYDWPDAYVSLKVSAGKFLAQDYGARAEVCRYFTSGFRLYFWYTYTNAHDYINGQRYQDKGIGFSMPLDIFYTRSSRSRWGYGMAAWLRDIGAKAFTGPELYYIINDQRQ